MKLTVFPKRLRLQFNPLHLRLSASEKFAVVWGPPGTISSSQMAKAPAVISVIDLQKESVVATQNVPTGVSLATINDRFVFYASADGKALYRTGLNLRDRKRTLLAKPPFDLITFEADKLAVVGP